MMKKRQAPNKAPTSLKQALGVFTFRYKKAEHVPIHSHPYNQLIYATEGCMKIMSVDKYWVIPPQRGVWVPAGIEHEVIALTNVLMKTLYINRYKRVPFNKNQCCVISISPLVRELIDFASNYKDSYNCNGSEARLLRVLQDQLALLSVEPLMLPKLQDNRLKKIAAILQQNPGDNRNLSDWGNKVGASSRTLTRLFLKNTAMTFQRWRTQFRLLKSIELLAQQKTIQQISEQLGYASPGTFIYRFRKELGVTPKRYFGKS